MKLVIKNIASSLLLQLVTIICGFIVPKLIISNYGSDVNGMVTSITQFLAYITLLEAGFGPVVKSLLYKPIVKNDKETIKKILKASEKIFRRIAYIFIIYIAILCLILPNVISDNYDFLFKISLILIISISTFFEYYFGMTYKLFLHADQKVYVTQIINTSTLIINTLLIIILVKFGSSIQVVKLVSAFIFLLRPLLHNLYVKRKYGISLKGVDDTYAIKQKWDALLNHIAFIIRTNTDVVVLTLFSSIKEVSVYSIYMLITNCLKSIVYSFAGGIDASFGKMVAKDEHEKLKEKFNKFVTYYYSISSIIFISAFFLIVPFVSVYTKGIVDADYIRPVFGGIMVFAVFALALKDPYNDLIKVVGHFKQTKKGAFVEAILNIIISLSLVFKFGLIGVAIGTVVSTFVRTIEISIYSTKKIIKTSLSFFIERLIVIVVDFFIIFFIVRLFDSFKVNNYVNWFIYACIVTLISTVVVFGIELLLKLIKKNQKNVDIK